MSLLLDTHVVLWWLAGGERLSKAAASAIETADHLLVSPLSCWEIATLERAGRLHLDRDALDWVRDLMATPRIDPAPLSAAAAAWGGTIDGARFPGDPTDRLLYATARDLRVPLVSKDERLRAYAQAAGDVTVIW